MCRCADCTYGGQRAPACVLMFFFFNDTATTEIYTLSLHDALPICLRLRPRRLAGFADRQRPHRRRHQQGAGEPTVRARSEEHTSELQSRQYLVCRLLLEKKKTNLYPTTISASIKARMLNQIQTINK